MVHSGSNPRRQTSTTQVYKHWPHGMTNVAILEMNKLKNSSILAVTFPVNLSIKLYFVSVKSPSKTYFMDALCTVYLE